MIMLKRIKPISLILLSLAVCSIQNIHATSKTKESVASATQQQTQITGNIIDVFGPVTGASVVVKGTTNGMISDLDGNFTLEIGRAHV